MIDLFIKPLIFYLEFGNIINERRKITELEYKSYSKSSDHLFFNIYIFINLLNKTFSSI